MSGASVASKQGWFERGVGIFSRACGVVEDALGWLINPIAEDLTGLGRDLKAATKDWAAKPARRQVQRLRLTTIRALFARDERQSQLRELQGEAAGEASAELQDARRQLLIGAATVGADILATLTTPTLFIVGLVGLFYQMRFLFRETYKSISEEHRVGVHGLNLVLLAGALWSGSAIALSLAVFSMSFLRYTMAKAADLAQRGIASAFARQPREVFIVVGDVEARIRFEDLRVGDTLVVSAGQMIPVDGVITKGTASVDQHMLTGESQPADMGSGDRVLCGTIVLSGRLYIQVEKSGEDTLAAHIARSLADTSNYKQELRARAERQQDRLALPTLALAALTMHIWNLDSALGVLWSLPGYRMTYLSPLTMMSILHLAARRRILIKNGRVLERLRAVDTVVFDKTGTLTLEQPEVGRIFPLAELPEHEILRLAAAAEHQHTHPVARAIEQERKQRGITPSETVQHVDAEINLGFGVQVTVSGKRVRIGSERLMALSEIALTPRAVSVQVAVHELGHSLVFVAQESTLVGAIELRPRARAEAAALVAQLRRQGKHVMIVSGDHLAPTRRLAAQLGVDSHQAQALPEDKAKLIEKLQREAKVVCYVGDGINDSLAMQQADVAVSLKGATEVATTASDVVLMNDDLTQMLELFELAAKFERYMRINRITSDLPAYLILAGTMALGWSYLTAVLLSQLTIPLSLYNVLKPAMEYEPETPQETLALPGPRPQAPQAPQAP